MAPAVVGVVGHDHVARMKVVAEEVDGQSHRQGRGQHELGNADGQRGQPAVLVEDRRFRSFDWFRIGVVAVRET